MVPPAHEHLSKGDLLFAYGTLKTGGQYHSLIREIEGESIGMGTLVMPYPLVLADYPCLIDQPSTGYRVKGEVFRIPEPENWDKLDWLEGHPEEYLRRPEAVEIDGQVHFAWTYFYLQTDRLPENWTAVREFPVNPAQGRVSDDAV